MFKVQTLNKISSRGLDLLPREDFEVATEIPNPDGMILRSFKMHDMELPESLKGIARAGAGVNNIPVEKCTEQGIVVFNTPGANANGVKELVLTSLLLSSRDILGGVTWARGLVGEGDMVPKLVEKGKSDFAGCEIKGRKLGVIGLGAIGVMVANDAVALGMDVIGYDPFISVEAAWGMSAEVKRAAGLESLIAECDYITIHAPLTDKTKGMMNEEKFALVKKGCKLMNFARGGLVNNDAVKKALADGQLGAYVTDFPDEDLLDVEGVIPIPHLGASTEESEDNCAVMAAKQLKNFLETGNIKNSVNFPDCELPYIGKKRIVVANKNVPNMIGQITSILAEDGINILDMLNKSRGEIGYNIIDVEGDLTEDDVKKIGAIEGVIMLKVI
ncbi:MAG: phosphoglycerate dehydrogenase [Planctomycetota bacterium]|jgi:D-3-phosphoglycerate dehydrogenase